MKIGLLGYGTVGKSFYELCKERSDIACVKTLLSRRARPELDCIVTDSIDDILNDSEIDTVVEVMGGIHPAYEYISAAIRAGKNIVTANKAVVSEYYDEFNALTEQYGVCFMATASAGGGIPWLVSLSRVAELDKINAFSGILNGTTNFILSKMTDEGSDYGECLKEAQRIGFAEADPTADVEGYDARRKVVISTNIAFGASVNENDIPCVGISRISAGDIDTFKAAGLTVKLIGHAARTESGVSACVEPMLFTAASPESGIKDGYNIINLFAERIGKQSFIGLGAGGYPTGANVLSDCLAIARGAKGFYAMAKSPLGKLAVDNSGLMQSYYIRTKAPLPPEIKVVSPMGSGVVCEPVSVKYAHEMLAELKKADDSSLICALA